MSYLSFLLYFLIPPICGVIILTWFRGNLSRLNLMGIFIMALIALVYTTPWDNYLIMRGVWSYPVGAVLGVIGYVPLEEYTFMMLQTCLAGLVWFSFCPGQNLPRLRFSWIGFIGGIVVGLLGLLCMLQDSGTYAGLILIWAFPPLVLQWGLGLSALLHSFKPLLLLWFMLTLYLCLADSYAISQGIWTLALDTRTGWEIGNLPLEEALFFAVTNLFVLQGLTLWQSWRKLEQ